jgi:hypothetical protein
MEQLYQVKVYTDDQFYDYLYNVVFDDISVKNSNLAFLQIIGCFFIRTGSKQKLNLLG